MESRIELLLRQRVLTLFLVLSLFMFFVSGRLVWIQAFQTDTLRTLAVEQRLRLLQIEPRRGIIYDRLGREMAVSTSAETVVALPPEIDNPQSVARELAGVLNLSFEEILRRLQQPRAAMYLERKVDADRIHEVRQLGLKGITFIEESKRFYPQQDLACHILGFAGIDSQGLEGVEVTLDRYLSGIPGRIATEKDAIGLDIPQGLQQYIPPQDGYDVYLTIDQILQYIAERELEQAMVDNEAKGGTIIIMDPFRGDILAMANRPGFDPNAFQGYPSQTWRNLAISDSYEPGSAFKIITMAAALDEGVVSMEDRFFDPGYINVAGETINCWRAGGHGSQSFQEVVENSCNPGFVQLGIRLGKDSFQRYVEAFNFGDQLGIDLPGEARGMVYAYDELGPVELATMTFGHGIAVTPLQMITATAALANGGNLLQPRIVKEIRDQEGDRIIHGGPSLIRPVISKETADLTLQLLGSAVESGTGGQAKIEGYEVGGKTGTAKQYGVEAYDASFVGIVPLNDPQMVILVVLYGVTSYPYYGGQIAAPVFRNVAYDALRYLEIPPSRSVAEGKEDVPKRTVPDVTQYPTMEAVERLKNEGFQVRLEGDGSLVLEQVPRPGAVVPQGSTVILFFHGSISEEDRYYTLIPDVRGQSSQDASELLSSLGFVVEAHGEGRVTGQTPNPMTRKPQGSIVQLNIQ